jgi:hypothetical protein
MDRSNMSSHIKLISHLHNLDRAKADRARADERETQLNTAYTAGDWSQIVPAAYKEPVPAQIAQIAPIGSHSSRSAPAADVWPDSRDSIDIVLPPVFNHDAEHQRIDQQAELIRQLDQERDEFGEDFFDEDEPTREARASFEALGEPILLM